MSDDTVVDVMAVCEQKLLKALEAGSFYRSIVPFTAQLERCFVPESSYNRSLFS